MYNFIVIIKRILFAFFSLLLGGILSLIFLVLVPFLSLFVLQFYPTFHFDWFAPKSIIWSVSTILFSIVFYRSFVKSNKETKPTEIRALFLFASIPLSAISAYLVSLIYLKFSIHCELECGAAAGIIILIGTVILLFPIYKILSKLLTKH